MHACAHYDLSMAHAGWQQVRNFYGLPTEQFHQPCALWHASGFYIMATAAAGHIYVFHVGTAKVFSNCIICTALMLMRSEQYCSKLLLQCCVEDAALQLPGGGCST